MAGASFRAPIFDAIGQKPAFCGWFDPDRLSQTLAHWVRHPRRDLAAG